MVRPRPSILASDSARIVAVTALFFVVACALGIRLSIWLDEAFSLYTTGAGIPHAIHAAIFFELQPPLYFLLLALWRELNSSDFFARLFSIAAATATIPIAAAFAKRHISATSATLTAILLALNPFLLWTAEEIRVYALIALLSALLMFFLFEAYLDGTTALGIRAAYIVTAIAALYTQYYLGSLLLAGGAAILVFQRKHVWAYLVDMLVVAIVALPIVGFLHQQLGQELSGGYHVRATKALTIFASSLLEFVVPYHWFVKFPERTLLYGLLTCLVLLGLGFAGYSVLRGRSPVLTRLLLFTGVVTAFFAVVIARYPATFYFPRHITALFVPCELVLVALVACVPPVWQTRVAMLVLLGALGLGYASDASTYRDFEKKGHWRQVASYLDQHARPGQTIFIYNGGQTLPFIHYFHGANPVVGIPGPPHLDRFVNRRAATRIDRRALGDTMRRSLSASGSAWFLETSGFGPYYEAGAATIAAEVASSFQVLAQKKIGDSYVELLRLPPSQARLRSKVR